MVVLVSRFIAAALAVGLCTLAVGQTATPTIWFSPHFFSSPTANSVQVSLFGKTKSQSSVTIDPNLIVTANPEFDPAGMTKTLGTVLSTMSNREGFFKLNFELPLGVVQIPILISEGSGARSNILMTLQVEQDSVKISLPTKEDEPQVRRWRQDLQAFVEAKAAPKAAPSMNSRLVGLWLHAGLGYNYQSHSQTLTDTAKMEFESLKVGSLGLLASYAKQRWLINLGHRQTPGEAGGVSAPYSLESPKFIWSNTLVEGGWVVDQAGWREQARIVYLYGFQQHFVPQFEPTSDNRVIQRSFEVTVASLGIDLTTNFSKSLMGNLILRYQHPIGSTSLNGREFEVKPELSFDGSLGLLHRLSERSYWGVFWFGHWLKYDFSSQASASQAFRQGEQSLFYSNLDFRYVIQIK